MSDREARIAALLDEAAETHHCVYRHRRRAHRFASPEVYFARLREPVRA